MNALSRDFRHRLAGHNTVEDLYLQQRRCQTLQESCTSLLCSFGPEGWNVRTRFDVSTLSRRITESCALTNSAAGLSRSNGQTRRQGKYRDITAEGMTMPLHAS